MKRIIIVFFVVFCLFLFLFINTKKQGGIEPKEEVKYDLVKYRNIEVSFECEGLIEAYKIYKFYPPEKSMVEKIFKYPGEVVHKGDTIARLSNHELEYRYEKARYELTELNKNLNEILSSGSLKNYYTKEIKELKEEMEKKKIEFSFIKKEYERLNIVAPFNGFVLRINAKVGEYIEGEFLKLSNIDTLLLKVRLSIEELLKLKVGQKIKVIFYSHNNSCLEGIVLYLNYEGEKIKENYEFFAGIKFRRHRNMLPGSKANVKILYDFSNRLSIPSDAIIEKNGKYFVLLKNGEIRGINIGLSGSQFTEVLSGVVENDTIVSGPVDYLHKSIYGK